MTPEGIHIVAYGARTALGLRAASSAAAYRAGISGAREHPAPVDPEGRKTATSFDQVLDPTVALTERLLVLAETALREACAFIEDSPLRRRARPSLLVGLPEHRPGFAEADGRTVRDALSKLDGLPIEIGEISALARGHAGGLAMIDTAVGRLRDGVDEICIAGGVDSYADAKTLAWLAANGQLAGTSDRFGFVPGEAASFIVLMRESMRVRCEVASKARIGAIAVGRETKLIKTQEICLGEGLSELIDNVTQRTGPGSGRINGVICDINGERYRSEEWGFTCLRHSAAFDDPTAYWSPADSWGDVGAASGPLFASLACEAAARGYVPGPRMLLWAGSERGLRAAAVLETPARIH